MVGLVKALELYAEGADSMTPDALATTVDRFPLCMVLARKSSKTKRGRAIWRVQVRVHPDVLGIDARQVEALLRTGDVAIYTRRYFLHQGVFSIDPRTLDQSELAMIVERLAQISAEQENCHAKH
jgi:D-glucosaminate-6-phosphate ammonia-lyase